MTQNSPLLTTAQAAEYLGVPESQLVGWRTSRSGVEGPPVVRLGHRTVRYRLSALEAFIESREQRADG